MKKERNLKRGRDWPIFLKNTDWQTCAILAEIETKANFTILRLIHIKLLHNMHPLPTSIYI